MLHRMHEIGWKNCFHLPAASSLHCNKLPTYIYPFHTAKRLPPDVNTRSVFANTELNLGEIEVYGFDYDYTLATYRAAVEEFIYAEAKKALVYKFKVR